MLRSRFFLQLYSGYAVVVLVFACIVGLTVTDWVADQSLQDLRTSLRVKATFLAEVAAPVFDGERDLSVTRAATQRLVAQLGESTGTRLTVIAKDGEVLADSDRDPKDFDNHADRPEVREARENAAGGYSSRYSTTIGRDMMYYARAVRRDAELLGFVRASFRATVIEDRLARVRGLVVLGAAIAALIALLLGWWFTRRVTRRLQSLTGVAQAIVEGDYSRRVSRGARDEIGRLGDAYNAMAEQMQLRIQTITEDRNTTQAILRSMVEGVVAVDDAEVVLHMNSVAGEILDVEPGNVIGKRIWEAARVNEIARALSKSLGGEIVHDAQVKIMRGDVECYLDIKASPFHDLEGTTKGAVVVFHDVTEIRHLEQVRREFVVNASHELKTPITAIRGFVETMLDDAEMPDEIRTGFLRRVHVQADRLATLVTDLLQLSRFEGSDEAARERLDLREVAKVSVAELRAVAADQGIEVSVDLPEGPVEVMGDRSTLALLVDNLVDNAIKYSEPGTDVQVVVRRGDRAELSVVDHGIGIHPDDVQRIFERFYRVDKARSRAVGGTGLGLAIVKHACTMLKAEIDVESRLGLGSTFRVRMPLA